MGVRTAVAGASGYAGGELLRLLSSHPAIELVVATAQRQAGRPVPAVHPQLPNLQHLVLGETSSSGLAGCELVFLALPHGASAALARDLPPDLVVVDLGADHRLVSAEDWASYYQGPHAGVWAYGMPELGGQRAVLSGARRVANPGCYATAVTLSLAPLMAHGLVEPQDVVVVAASGTSGAGRDASESLLGSEVMGSMRPYKVGGVHQHIPEIEQALGSVAGSAVRISFTPTLAPMPRGILATSTARLRPGSTLLGLRAAMGATYADEPFVHLLPEGQWPTTGATAGGNAVQLQVTADHHSGRAIVVCAIDNLGKGAAGQAVQNANLALGLAEATGLSTMGVAP